MHGNCIYLNLISFFCYVEFLNLYLYVKKKHGHDSHSFTVTMFDILKYFNHTWSLFNTQKVHILFLSFG